MERVDFMPDRHGTDHASDISNDDVRLLLINDSPTVGEKVKTTSDPKVCSPKPVPANSLPML